MSMVQSGVLRALVDYYNRLESDPGERIAGFGFSREKIHYCALLEPDGALSGGRLVDVRSTSERGAPVPTLMLVPDGGGRSGTGIKPFFCWDNTGYTLGRDNKGRTERAERMFAAFRDAHLAARNRVGDDDGFDALCRFLERWDPVRAETIADWDEIAGKNIVFRLRGREAYVHQSEAVKRAWLESVKRAERGERGISLLTGQEDELARLHPLIGGVSGANATGAAIVSFNLDAFSSYGKSQSYNAPVGARDAFRYTTALNRLLADSTRRVHIGDATVVFWSDRRTEAEEWFADIIEESSEDKGTLDRVRSFLAAARDGRLDDVIADPNAPFYILGLSPNASRLNVRFWLPGTVRQFAQRLEQLAEDLEMAGTREGEPPLIIRGLVYEAMPREGAASNRERQIAQLAGELVRSVFTGHPFPKALFSGILRRIRADHILNHRRAAALKACIVRDARLAHRREEIPVSLNKDHPDAAYQMGRLFAAIEKTQEEALPGLNKTIRDGYFGTAAATPGIVFPRLFKLNHHHVVKLAGGHRVNREKLIREICGHIDQFPTHLSLERQGLFYIGYYHQRQDLFTPKGEQTEKEEEVAA